MDKAKKTSLTKEFLNIIHSFLKERTKKWRRKQELSAKELLNEVYDIFKRDGGKEIALPLKAEAEVADDSDGHRIRIGRIGYESAILIKIDGKEWILAFGEKCGDYPADIYSCDIAAIKLSSDGKSGEKIAAESHNALKRNTYFYHSLIYARANGQLGLNKDGSFGQRVFEILEPKVQEFIAQGIEIGPDKRPLIKSTVLYKPELVAFLYDMFRAVLSSQAEPKPTLP